MKLIMDVINEIDACPGLSAWDFSVCCYAVELLETYILDTGLTVWDEADALKSMTEEDLLNGSKDWKQYSRDGNALIWREDICRRLFGGNSVPAYLDLLECQGRALEKAAMVLLKTIA